jgi:molybdate transport system substrate-binding protein
MRRLARVSAILALLAFSPVVAGAATAGAEHAAEGPATVLAAASLTEVLPHVDEGVRASFGGSNQLAEQARQGFPFDVFLSASPLITQALFADGLVRKPVPFATNSLVLIVPWRNPARIASVADLARRPGLRLVVAGPQVPIGLYTRVVLKRLGLLRVLRKTVSLEPDVKGIVGKVALGEADAGFVYATDVRPVASKVRVIRFPRRAQPTVVYEAAIAAKPRDLVAAQSFLITLLGPEGRHALRAAGFGLPQ